MTLTAEIRWKATALAHEAALTLGCGDPDADLHGAAAEHRRQLREALLRTIADYEQERMTDDGC